MRIRSSASARRDKIQFNIANELIFKDDAEVLPAIAGDVLASSSLQCFGGSSICKQADLIAAPQYDLG